jgi:alkaline phosphatase D
MAAGFPALGLPASTSNTVFAHGVASGDPLSDRVILWTRVSPTRLDRPARGTWLVARDTALQDIVRSGSFASKPEQDFTVKIDATGLQPGQTYYYQFKHSGTASPIGRTRTLPVGAVDRLRCAVVSCSNFAAGYFNAYARLAERADLDLVIHLGDYLYEYGSGQYGSVRACEPGTELLSLSDYRQRHAQYKRDADAQAMHRQHPVVAIWDDHEMANDAWQGGAQNHTEGLEGPWSARKDAALQAYLEWMPVRQVDRTDPSKSQRSLAFGDLISLILLEGRLSARSQQLEATIPTLLGPAFAQTDAFADPNRSLLGTSQESWLTKQLRRTGTRWKMLGQGVMFAQLKAVGDTLAQGGGLFLNSDQWDGYQPARDRLYKVIRGQDGGKPVRNLVVLTGDIHSSWAADLCQDPNNPDLSSGGYDPSSGQGAVAVEFVGTSVTSPGLDDPKGTTTAYMRSQNPHFKYVNLDQRGYMLLDISHSRVVCEWWHVATVAQVDARQTMAAAFQVRDGVGHLEAAAQTASRNNPPALAP